MKALLKYTAFVFLGIVLVLTGFLFYLLSNKAQIKEYALDEINKQLTVKLEINEVDITLFRQFPKVSLDLKDVSIADPLRKGRHLLRAGHIYAGFNLYDIIRRNYTIRLITIDEGTVSLYTGKKGQSNYFIFRKAENETEGSFLLSLKEVKLNGVETEYINEQNGQQHSVLFRSASLYGDFSERGERIGIKGDLTARKLKSDRMLLVKNKPMKLDLVVKTDHRSGTFIFEKGYVDIDQLRLSFTGRIVNKPAAVHFDLETSARDLDIRSLLSLLPLERLPGDLESDGDLYLSGTIRGDAGANSSPAIRFSFGVKEGSLRKGNGTALKNISLKGEFSNGSRHNMQSSQVSITDLYFTLNGAPINGHFTLSNFSDPLLITSLKGQLPARDLLGFLQNETIKSADGILDFDIDFNGKVSNLNTNKWLNNQSKGNVSVALENITFRQNDRTIRKLRADLSLENRNALIRMFEAEIDQSDIRVSGRLNNVIPYLLLPGQPLEADITYQSNHIDLNSFIMPLSPVSMDDSKKGFALPENIVIDAAVKTTRLVYKTFSASNVSANVHWKGKKIMVENLSAQTLDGSIRMDGEVENARDGRFLISTTSTLSNIDINAMFRSCKEFGQDELTSKHIQGRLSGTIDLVSVWNNNLECDLNKLYALCQVEIRNGELNGYKPLEALGKYVDVNELRNLKFADLRNTIEIRNRTIFIPAFDIRNNALNLTLAGSHTFENYIDYRVRIRLNELLKKKRRPSANEFNEEETPDGGLNLYLSMKGPIDNFRITYDKREVKQQLKQDVKKEGRNIREILKQEFGGSQDKGTGIKEKKGDDEELEFEPE